MITIHIPHEVAAQAIQDLTAGMPEEVIGFFAMEHMPHIQGQGQRAYNVVWRKMTNIAENRWNRSQVAAEQMAQMILDDTLAPIAMLHSHPSGDVLPSREDREEFPSAYVDSAYVWSPEEPTIFTQYYTGSPAHSFQTIDQLFLTVQW